MDPYFNGPWLSREPDAGHRKAFDELGPKIVLFDLGAAGGTPPPFCFVPDSIELVNFEPDGRVECAPGEQQLPVALGPKHLRRLNLNRRPTTSSLLDANANIVGRYDWSVIFGEAVDIFETMRTVEVDTYGLDEIIETKGLKQPDFLKIDVQGLSLEVLESGARCLRDDVIGLQIEVEFLESYTGQKTFGEVHEYLYHLGVEIFTLSNVNAWYYRSAFPLKMRTGQHTFCDLTYFRRIDSIEQDGFWTPERAKQALRLLLLHDLTDTAAAYLERFQRRGLLTQDLARVFARLIGEWEGALGYFYHPERYAALPRRRFVDRVLDVNLRKIIRKLRHPTGGPR
jgi:FkbM family methyltransferase